MIHFVSLFLSLTVGVHPVELAVVDSRVASIELVLDGRVAGADDAAPWVVECDFGDDLRPHVMVAIARDAEGRELDRVKQRINLPRPMAEVDVVIEGGDPDPYRARVVWAAVDNRQPTGLNITLDGVAVPVVDHEFVELPELDGSRVHILTAELVLNEVVLARTEMAFGGPFGESVSSDLTAVPLQLRERSKIPAVDELTRWLRVNGRKVEIVGVEHETWDVLVVRDRDAGESLADLGRRAGFMSGHRSRRSTRFLTRGLRRSDSLRLVYTSPTLVPSGDGATTALFQVSSDWAHRADGSIPWLLFNVPPKDDRRRQHFAWAVASAGLTLAGSHRARAVVLVKEPPSEDAGLLEPTTVRGYLESINVPLFVWRPSKIDKTGPEDEDGWGAGRDISKLDRLNRAVRDLRRSLEKQFIVWIEGDHVPRELTLTDEGFREAGFAGDFAED